MYRLATIYHEGKGVPRNYEYAYAWAVLAVDSASNEAEKDNYLPLVIHLAVELDTKAYERAKQMKDELSKSVRGLSEW